jgi:hypothetical protein
MTVGGEMSKYGQDSLDLGGLCLGSAGLGYAIAMWDGACVASWGLAVTSAALIAVCLAKARLRWRIRVLDERIKSRRARQ